MDQKGIGFEDLRSLLNYCLKEFYSNDKSLLNYDTESKAVAERCMVFHIGWYMLDRLKTLAVMQGLSVDSEYNRNFTHPKGMYKQTYGEIDEKIKKTYPDLILHKRRSNSENILVIEFKKGKAKQADRNNDYEKLVYFTDQNKEYKYKFGFYVELYKSGRAKVFVFQNGKRMSNLDYVFE